MEEYQLWREAGLPKLADDTGGIYQRYGHRVGVVRAVYADLWRVDIESEDGGLLRLALVDDDQLPETHINTERPSFVEYWYADGRVDDVRCHVLPFRRLDGPEGEGKPEKRLYHKHLMIRRVGDLTLRITADGKKIYLYDSEQNDIAMYEQDARTFHVTTPHVFIGTDAANRVELHAEGKTTDQFRVVIPQALIGATGQRDADGITYVQNQLLHFVSTLIKLTAQRIVLDPVDIRLGSENATERAILGDLFQTFYNAFVALFNTHQHSNVQPGSGTSGPPTTPTPLMTNALLSDVVHISKTGN